MLGMGLCLAVCMRWEVHRVLVPQMVHLNWGKQNVCIRQLCRFFSKMCEELKSTPKHAIGKRPATAKTKGVKHGTTETKQPSWCKAKADKVWKQRGMTDFVSFCFETESQLCTPGWIHKHPVSASRGLELQECATMPTWEDKLREERKQGTWKRMMSPLKEIKKLWGPLLWWCFILDKSV